MLRRGIRGRTGPINDDHGAAMAEYMPLLAVIAVLVIFTVSFFGPWVSEQLVDASLPFDEYGCPSGWDPRDVTSTTPPPTKKNGKSVDTNGDHYVCVKDIPGNGQGNTGGGQNVKDNNRDRP